MYKLQAGDLPHYNYEDYISWEGNWELIKGSAVAMSPASMINHQAISYAIARELGACPRTHLSASAALKIR